MAAIKGALLYSTVHTHNILQQFSRSLEFSMKRILLLSNLSPNLSELFQKSLKLLVKMSPKIFTSFIPMADVLLSTRNYFFIIADNQQNTSFCQNEKSCYYFSENITDMPCFNCVMNVTIEF